MKAYPFRNMDVDLTPEMPCAFALLTPHGNVITSNLRADDVDRFVQLLGELAREDAKREPTS